MNAFSSPRFRLGWILILTGLFFASIGTFFRWRYENQLVRTQLTMDIEDSKTLSDAFGVPQAQLLKAFKEKGIRSVAIYDQSLANYRDNGRLSVTPREEAERLFPLANWKDAPPVYRYLVTSTDGDLLAHVRPQLEEQALVKPRPIVLREARSRGGELPFGLLIPASKQLMNDAQLGFDPRQVALAKAAGLGITLRLSNSLNFTPDRMERVMDDAQKIGARVVIFSDEEVMGYQTLIAATAREMRKRGLIFTAIEFSKQRGAEEFARSTEGLLARVHSVSGDEAAKAKIDVLVERYTRAAKERNIRVLYMRFLRQAKGAPVPHEGGSW